jgi:hypothetical protein
MFQPLLKWMAEDPSIHGRIRQSDVKTAGRGACAGVGACSTSCGFDVYKITDQKTSLSSPIFYSHSMVLGGLEEMSKTTRLTPLTSLMIRLEILASTSEGILDQSAVMASTLSTIRRAITLS